jgi:hypothetical protein
MSVSLSDLKPGKVAISVTGKIAVIVDYKATNKKYPIIYKVGISSTTYKGNADDFKAIIGDADLDKFKEQLTEDSPNRYDDDEVVPNELKGIKIGDSIRVRNGAKTIIAEYLGYNPNRPKNCVSIRVNSREMKGPLSCVIGKA